MSLVACNLILPELCPEPGEIEIYHPGYQDEKEPLLTLIGYDTTDGGLWREVAITACAIITNNSFDGELKTEDGQIAEGEILMPGKYWWHLPDTKYPVIAEFRNWPFPETFPDIWRTPRRPTRDVAAREVCCLTKLEVGKQKAHIIPKGETTWFEKNRMGRLYSRGNRDNSVHHNDNVMVLRSDLHGSLDAKLFAFFPKNDKVVIHGMVLEMSPFQNAPLLVDVCREFLLARFAWTLFPICLAPWLKMQKQRRLWIEVDGKLEPAEVSAETCQLIAHSLRPGSTSPKKRKLEDIVLQPSQNLLNLRKPKRDSAIGSSSEEEEENEELALAIQWEENRRGRKRIRGDH